MKLKKMLAAVTAVSLAVSAMSAAGFTASADDEIAETIVSVQADAAADLPDNAELEAMYLNQLFYGDYGISLYKDYGKTALTETQFAIYTALKTEIEKIAAGTRTNTVIEVAAPAGITTGDELSAAVSPALKCLMVDLPQSLYWCDKSSTPISMLGSTITITFKVAQAYQDGDDTTVNSEKITTAQTAVNNAKTIADKYKNETPYNKILGYKTEICNLTEYDTASAADDNTPYGDPWQLVYVFDNNPSTTVVCEGYSKAFQYLCDLGGVDCYTVSGTMKVGNGSAGPHMWNIVKLGGKSYLVDVTNCDGTDESRSVGYPDLLFLKGASASSATSCTMKCNSSNVVYTYDADIMYPADLLTVSTTDYDPAGDTSDDDDDDISTEPVVIFDSETDGVIVFNELDRPKYGYKDIELPASKFAGINSTGTLKITVSFEGIEHEANVDTDTGVIYAVLMDRYWKNDRVKDSGNLLTELTKGNGVGYLYFDTNSDSPVFTADIGTSRIEEIKQHGLALLGYGFKLLKVEYIPTETPEHTHVPEDYMYMINHDNHWHYCTVDGCGERLDLGSHTYVDGVCSVCGIYSKYMNIDDPEYDDRDPEPPVEPDPSNPSAPSTPSTPSTSTPTTSSSSTSVSQTTIIDKILATPDGGNGSVNLGSSTKVDKLTIEAIAEKGDVTIKLSVAGGAYWEINGKNVTNAKDVNLGVKVNSKLIPASKVEAFAGDKTTIQLTLSHNGDLGFTGTLNVPVGSSNNGKFANLYYYHGGKFDFVGSSPIKGGRTQFAFSHASNYLIVIDDYAYGEDVSSAAGMTETTTETNAVPYVAVLIVISAFGAYAIVFKKRLSK